MIYLASQSTRRQELLKLTGLEFEIKPLENFDERRALKDYSGDVVGQAEFLSRAKAVAALASNLTGTFITADTIVISDDGVVLGKPSDESEAALFLDRLAGNWHTVATGVAVSSRDISEKPGDGDRIESILVTTRVKFFPMSGTEILEYIATGEPFDKAGGYGIQGQASKYIEKIEGCYFNVVGFPISAFWKLWNEFNK